MAAAVGVRGGGRVCAGVCVLLVAVAAAAGEGEGFDPADYVAPDATPVDLGLARRAVERAAGSVRRLEARYGLFRDGERVGRMRVRYERPGRLRLDAEIDGRAIVYVVRPERLAVRSEHGVVVAELGALFAGVQRCFRRAEPLWGAAQRDAVRGPGLSVGYRVAFAFDEAGRSEGNVWAGIEVQRRPRVQFGLPDRLWTERWHAYHEGATLRFLQPHRDLRVERATGIMRTYVLRDGGRELRRAELEWHDLAPPPFGAGVFELSGKVDEAASRALGMQTLSRVLQATVDMLARARIEGEQASDEGADRQVAIAFAEALAGAFAAPLRAEARRQLPPLWEALAQQRPDPEARAALAQQLMLQRWQAMLRRAAQVHGVDAAAAAQRFERQSQQLGKPAQRGRSQRFGAAIARAQRIVLAAGLDNDLRPALEQLIAAASGRR